MLALCWQAAGERLHVVGPQFLERINAAVDPGALPWSADLCQDVVKQELHVHHGRKRAHRPKDWNEGVSLGAVALRWNAYLCQDVDRRDVHAEGGRLSLFGQAEVKDLGPAGCAEAGPALCKDLEPHGFRLHGLGILVVVHGVIKAQFPCGMLFFSQQVQFLMTCYVQFCRGMESRRTRFVVPDNYLRGLPVTSPSATPLVQDFCSKRVKPCLSAYRCSRIYVQKSRPHRTQRLSKERKKGFLEEPMYGLP